MDRSIKRMQADFEKAYELYADAIFRHCYYRLDSRERALDLTQETFIWTWDYILGGRRIENMRAFLYKTATNLIIDSSRKKRELSLEEFQADGYEFVDRSTDFDLTDQIDAEILIKLVESLGEMYREAILLRYVEDLSIEEIAEIVNASEGAVSVRIHRGIKQLKEMVRQKDEKSF